MADVQTQLKLSTLGTREKAIKIRATIAVTDTADTTHVVPVVFDKPFVQLPDVLGCNTPDAGSAKGVPSCTDITLVGCNVNLYQALSGALATADHDVDVNLVGWQK